MPNLHWTGSCNLFFPLFSQLCQGHPARLKHWSLMGFALLILGITLHFTDGLNWMFKYEQICLLSINLLLSNVSSRAAIPLNKQLYTFSYVCVTSGAAALVFSAFYIIVCFFCYKHLISAPYHRFYTFEYGPFLLELRLGWTSHQLKNI